MDKPKRADLKCSGAEWCEAPVYAGGFCNAHYLRSRSGGDMDAPIGKKLSRKRKCCVTDCDHSVGHGGGNDKCQKHYVEHRFEIRKAAYLKRFGAACKKCGGIFPPCVYDFHHVDGDKKEGEISTMLRSASDMKLSEEISKCILLCANCHRIEHHG